MFDGAHTSKGRANLRGKSKTGASQATFSSSVALCCRAPPPPLLLHFVCAVPPKGPRAGRSVITASLRPAGTNKKDLVKIARQERQERQRQKELNERARYIQSAWRAVVEARACKETVRQKWDADMQLASADTAAAAAALTSPQFLSEFLFFHSRVADRER